MPRTTKTKKKFQPPLKDENSIIRPALKEFKYFDWGEIEQYIYAKYNKRLRSWPTGFNGEIKLNFWHYLSTVHQVKNGVPFILSLNDTSLETKSYSDFKWVPEVLSLLKSEFGSDTIPVVAKW